MPFPKPSPLPNQAGYNSLPSTQLERQTVEMEQRLEKIKNKKKAEELLVSIFYSISACI